MIEHLEICRPKASTSASDNAGEKRSCVKGVRRMYICCGRTDSKQVCCCSLTRTLRLLLIVGGHFLYFSLVKKPSIPSAQNRWQGAFALTTLDQQQHQSSCVCIFVIRSHNFPFVFSLCNLSCNTNFSTNCSNSWHICKATVVIWLKQHGFILLFSIRRLASACY